MIDILILLIALLPLGGFLVTAAIGRRLGDRGWWLLVGAVVASWLAAMVVVAGALSGAEPFCTGGYGITLF